MTADYASPSQKILVLDTETTGIPISFDNSTTINHEILQLAMIDGKGRILFSEYFKPGKHKVWPEAEAINGITPLMLKDKLSVTNYTNVIQSHIDTADLLVAYNFKFDYIFLRSVGISFVGKQYCDVMKRYALLRGKSEKYVSLETCAKQLGYSFDNVHNAISDAKATLYCFRKLEEYRLA
jgi:DNA polymerase III epsilon subunit-like protein